MDIAADCERVSSIVFSAGHIAAGNVSLVIYDVATIFIDSMIYTIVYHKSGNCLISTISHIFSNGVAIVVALHFFRFMPYNAYDPNVKLI